MPTREFTREALEEMGIPYRHTAEPGKAAERLHEEQVDTRRWVSVHEIIFRVPEDRKTYSVTYEEGLTEQQDADPWDYESTITAQEMEPYVVPVTKWRAV